MPKTEAAPLQYESLLNTFDVHSRITGYLLENLPPECWHAPTLDGKGRDIAAIAVHMYSVHCMWLKASGASPVPAPLDKTTATIPETLAALAESATLLRALIKQALDTGVRVKNFKPDTIAFLGYLIAHDAHHRGQISMLARQTGHPLSKSANFGLWEWGTR
jgi:uncharacterized damage-inducible protein DinB